MVSIFGNGARENEPRDFRSQLANMKRGNLPGAKFILPFATGTSLGGSHIAKDTAIKTGQSHTPETLWPANLGVLVLGRGVKRSYGRRAVTRGKDMSHHHRRIVRGDPRHFAGGGG